MVMETPSDLGRPLLRPLQAVGLWIGNGGCRIQDRDTGDIVPLKPNRAQRKLYAMMLRQAAQGRPIRIIVPKARKEGISTECQGVNVGLCSYLPNRRAMTYAQSDQDVKAIFALAHRMREGQVAIYGEDDSEATVMGMRWPHGSSYECRTARSESVSRGDTIYFLHASEWGSIVSASGMDTKAAAALLNAVPDSPATIIVLESTGNGPSGDFYERCKMAAEGKGEFELCFLAWFEDDRYRMPVPAGFEPTDDELRRMAMYGLDLEQIAWYRRKFGAACGDGSDLSRVAAFKREFPETYEDCFTVAEGRVYPHFSILKHSQKVDVSGSRWHHCRAIDWGGSYHHPFVCLWLAHDPTSPPSLTIDPDCTDVLREMQAYRINAKTGNPVKEDDHCPDCIRLAVCTFHLSGWVHVYRQYYSRNPPPADLIARRIHELSGWKAAPNPSPDGDSFVPGAVFDLSRYAPGPSGESYEGTVADRSRPDSINTFSSWGLPMIGHKAPAGQGSGKGEVADGILLVSTLLSGDAWLIPPPGESTEDVVRSAVDALTGRADPFGMGRRVELTRAQRAALAEARTWEEDYC